MSHRRRKREDKVPEKRKYLDFLDRYDLFLRDRSFRDIFTDPRITPPDVTFKDVTDSPKSRKDRYGLPVQYRLTRPDNRKIDSYNDRLSFVSPKKVKVCHSRKLRREVLFSLRRIGKGRGVSKPHRWTEDSKIKC